MSRDQGVNLKWATEVCFLWGQGVNLRVFSITLLAKNVAGQNSKKDAHLTMLTFGAIDATREYAVNVAAK